MLDPELQKQLAAHPDKNAPSVNAALAEHGQAPVLMALVRSDAAGSEALRTIARRIVDEREGLRAEFALAQGFGDDDPSASVLELEQLLLGHRAAPADARDAILARHLDDAFFVLAAASHPRATPLAVERAARWPCRAPVLERLWIALVPAEALGPLRAEEWSQDPDPLLREAAARLSRDRDVLERLSRDPSRQVRRSVASNSAAEPERARMAHDDPAAEVRARALAPFGEHSGPVTVDSARFAAALRAMQERGTLAADVAAALVAAGSALDEEGAMWAARLLPRERVVGLIDSCGEAACAAATGLALGLGLRDPADARLGGEDDFRELVVTSAKSLSQLPERFGQLTGKARLAAWLADGLANNETMGAAALVSELGRGPMAAEPQVLSRSLSLRPSLAAELYRAASEHESVPAALLELAWRSPNLDDEAVISLAKKTERLRPRGRDLPDDEIDLDPRRRSLPVLEHVVLAAGRAVTFAPRTALAVVALDSRRVRYVLTAMPSWRGRLSGAMLGRVLRQHAGALAAGPAEARSRGEQMRGWTERMLSDIELAVALAIGHITVEAMLERLGSHRHRLEDGVGLAAAAEARAAVAGPETVKPLLRWALRLRNQAASALAVWLLLEEHDRVRPASMIASAIDSLGACGGVDGSVSEALALLERRQPGRLEAITTQTPRGRAALASAAARAYRAVGGLRDDRGQ